MVWWPIFYYGAWTRQRPHPRNMDARVDSDWDDVGDDDEPPGPRGDAHLERPGRHAGDGRHGRRGARLIWAQCGGREREEGSFQ